MAMSKLRFCRYVMRESTDVFKHGFELPEFLAQLNQYPPGTEVSLLYFRGWRCQECVGEPVASD
jgi:hypothetical protein